jgi:hypothetical protein
MIISIHSRILKHIEIAENGCHLWTGSLDQNGYPMMWAWGQTRRVYRVLYKLEHGDITEDIDAHHKCKTRRCVNLNHIEFVHFFSHITVYHRGMKSKYQRRIDARRRARDHYYKKVERANLQDS